jgi:alcohol dehydrogenase/propanol-preferring alcohol dehydrogenase
MKLWAVVENLKPLEYLTLPDPEPAGTEVVMAVTHCGVCQSDLNTWRGEYDIGGGERMKITDRGVTFPRAPGHEVVGTVVAVGPEAQGVEIGDRRIIYPFIGCGTCDRCLSGDENLCAQQTILGIMRHGGFGSHVVAPHPRYLFDFEGIDAAFASTLACAGTTVYSAIRKLQPIDPAKPVLLIGAGGVGMTAIHMLRAMGHNHVIVVDVTAEKRAAALEQGATHALDGTAPDLTDQVREAAGGSLLSVIDFVNYPTTVSVAFDSLAKGGKLILVGVGKGDIAVSLVGMILRPRSIIGSVTGSLQDLRDVIELAKSGKFTALPLTIMAKDDANEAMERLNSGTVTGRIVLKA